MASTVCQTPATGYFSGPTRPQLNTITTYDWDNISDPTLTSDDSLSSPTSPDSLIFPQDCYTLPKEEYNPTIKSEDRFNFGTFEDWMRWDDPSDAALSPSSTDNTYFPDFKLEPTSPSMSLNDLELQGGISTLSNQRQPQLQDDSAIFGEVNEEPLFQTPGGSSLITPPIDLLSRETLYSTPLAWTRPQARSTSYSSLTPQEETKLRNIAMPPSLSLPNPSTSPSQNLPYTSPSSSRSPSPSSHSRNRKRKSTPSDQEDEDGSPPPSSGNGRPVKKTAHNMIEKRYRTNLNDKIAALRDSVPSLRVMSKKNSRGEEMHEDLEGLTPAHKLNKATVLSKATEYIAHLEKRNKYLVKENAALKSRVEAFEILVMARQPQGMKQSQNLNQSRRQSQVVGGMGQGQGYAGMM
ncbi:hypothetical protein L207DRAFT_590135 [Hyaloscypha variabilis F]|uniref:BHLH domain-containing protein n=1 Tax=Hyaloscypha variabilis (strain UAMH 11265 / GT02V1 / F) TaxID=1149755 RepID=A0A2J6R3H0_HYAVF|nr:hypothetical protein L207DRAFT_590135 [Hyaloscypha variabilis F]